MNSKQRLITALNFGQPDIMSAAPLPGIDLTSHRAIDEYLLEHEKITAEEIVAAGYTDHAAEIVRRYGNGL